MAKKEELNISTIEALFLTMVARGLTFNEADFSTVWLGLSESYYRLTGEQTNGMALFNCWDRLQSCGQFALAAECFKLVRERCRVNHRSVSASRVHDQRRAAREDARVSA